MKHRPLGRSGLTLPSVFGCNVFGWTVDETSSFRLLDAVLEHGLTFLDTADVYSRWVPGHSGGDSETIIGKWMKVRGNRSRIILATKVGMDMGNGKVGLNRTISRAPSKTPCDGCRPATSTYTNRTRTTNRAHRKRRLRPTTGSSKRASSE